MTHSPRLDAGVADAGSVARDDRDIFRLAPGMDAAVLETITARLEFRGTDEGYAQRSQAYFSLLPLAQARRIMASRLWHRYRGALPQAPGPSGHGHRRPRLQPGADRCRPTAHRRGGTIRQRHLPGRRCPPGAYGDAEFDVVTLHTLISHVDDPPQVLREARRLARPGGTVAIFDGDYASLTFAYPDDALAKTLKEKLIQLIVANPRIMRDLPRLLREAGLELVETDGTLYANIGSGRFWASAAESYGGLLGRSGLLPQALVDDWRAFQVQAAADNTFFGASNYYTYLTRRPE